VQSQEAATMSQAKPTTAVRRVKLDCAGFAEPRAQARKKHV
jgi:hypothetical protein